MDQSVQLEVSSDGSSSHYPDVMEIPLPTTMNNAAAADLTNQDYAILHDTINVYNSADDIPELTSMGVKVRNDRRKTILTIDDGYGADQTMEMYDDSVYKSRSTNEHGLGGDNEEYYSNMVPEEFMEIDQYSLIQEKFDSVNLHTGIEAPIPWLSNCDFGGHNITNNANVTQSSQPSLFLGPTNRKSKALEMGSYKSFETNKKPKLLYPSASHGVLVDNTEEKNLPHVFKAPRWGSVGMSMVAPGINTSFDSNFVGPYLHQPGAGMKDSYPSVFVESTSVLHPVAHNMWPNSTYQLLQPFPSFAANSNFQLSAFVPSLVPPLAQNFPHIGIPNNGAAANSALYTISAKEREKILSKFQSFKQFDINEDTSDHHFVHASSSNHSRNWAKRIQEEWKSLEKNLPDSIFVRVYESRIDLLRAVIIGAQGTPYHDGLFFFDVSFPSDYPNVPPHVLYHSGGLRLNPNLYNCGKVCLSLLNTWSGHENEKWIPGVSTILQVLVSIQGLILNSEPYFNEPGQALLRGSTDVEIRSLHFNENYFILTLKTMVYNMRNPPKNFNDFVVGYFNTRAHDILVACKAYMDGAQVGCLVKGGVQDVDQGDKSCTVHFKRSLAAHLDVLIKEFVRIGAKDDCEKVFSIYNSKNSIW